MALTRALSQTSALSAGLLCTYATASRYHHVHRRRRSLAYPALCRYAALLSSEALPGGLLDPAALGRLRADLLAGAAAAAQSSGVGYADLVRESSGDTPLK
jgi:hypothetical protein